MKKFIFFVFLFPCFMLAYGENVKLHKFNGKDDPDQIPVNVDVTDKILNIIITGNFEAEVIVTGPDGVVYQSRINAKNYHSVSVDLRQYADGDYTITFYDMEGNVIEGEFLLGYK